MKFAQSILGLKKLNFVIITETPSFKVRVIITNIWTFDDFLKNLLRNHSARKAETSVEASSKSVQMFTGIKLEGRGYIGVKNREKDFLKNQTARKARSCVKASSDNVDSTLFSLW